MDASPSKLAKNSMCLLLCPLMVPSTEFSTFESRCSPAGHFHNLPSLPSSHVPMFTRSLAANCHISLAQKFRNARPRQECDHLVRREMTGVNPAVGLVSVVPVRHRLL